MLSKFNIATIVVLAILVAACSHKDNANTPVTTASAATPSASAIASTDVADLAVNHAGNVVASAPAQSAVTAPVNEAPDQLPPFSGHKEFNFEGGTQTISLISIQDNGFTTIKQPISGEGIDMKFATTFKGKFTNPIKLQDGTGLLFKNDKVFRLINGKIDSSCSDSQSDKDNIPCSSELDNVE